MDPGTGKLLAQVKENGFLTFLNAPHDNALACTGHWYCISALTHPFPGSGTAVLQYLTWGRFILGLLGFLLIYLCLSGLVLWWPGVRRFARSLTVKVSRGRYRRDRDLHRVIGLVVIPFLLVFAVTGVGFSVSSVPRAAFALQGALGLNSNQSGGGSDPSFASAPGQGPDISYAQAAEAALRASGGGRITGYYLPGTDPAGTYSFYIDRGMDSASNYSPPFNVVVGVDCHNALRAAVTTDQSGSDPATLTFDGLGGNIHEGGAGNAWLQIVFLVTVGIVPWLLAVTGVSTWLFRRKRRKEAGKAGAAAPAAGARDDPDGLDDSLAPA